MLETKDNNLLYVEVSFRIILYDIYIYNNKKNAESNIQFYNIQRYQKKKYDKYI